MPKILKNLTNIDQSAFQADGTRVIIPALAEVQLSDELAQLFLTQRAQTVIESTPVTVPNIRGEELVWMANISGSPMVPPTVTIQIYDKELKAYVKREIPSLTAKPVEYDWFYSKGQVKVGENALGPVWETQPPQPIRVPPYTRVPVPKCVADKVVQNCGSRMPEARHHMKVCRAPTAYEPNDSWDYLDIHAYAELMDPASVNNEALLRPRDVSKAGPNVISKAKNALLKILFFMLIDERFGLPTEEAVKLQVSAYGKR